MYVNAMNLYTGKVKETITRYKNILGIPWAKEKIIEAVVQKYS